MTGGRQPDFRHLVVIITAIAISTIAISAIAISAMLLPVLLRFDGLGLVKVASGGHSLLSRRNSHRRGLLQRLVTAQVDPAGGVSLAHEGKQVVGRRWRGRGLVVDLHLN